MNQTIQISINIDGDTGQATGASIDYNDTPITDNMEVLKSVAHVLNSYIGMEDAGEAAKQIIDKSNGK